jgi:hypothetical protein
LVQVDVFAYLKTVWRIHLPANVKAAQSAIGQQGLDLVGQTKVRMSQGQVVPN